MTPNLVGNFRQWVGKMRLYDDDIQGRFSRPSLALKHTMYCRRYGEREPRIGRSKESLRHYRIQAEYEQTALCKTLCPVRAVQQTALCSMLCVADSATELSFVTLLYSFKITVVLK